MEEAVTNSTVLIVLSKINKLDLLTVFKQIRTTDEIYVEVLMGKDIPLAEKDVLEKFFKKYIKIESPQNKRNFDLGAGESSVLSLCCEKKNALFLSDDKKARKISEILGIKCLGTMGVIFENLQQKRITKEEAKNIVKLIVLNSYYLTTDLYARMIELIEKN